MARLERVTITGADDSISADSLAALSADFPFVEWGILVSASNVNTPRYPSPKWMARLCDWSMQVNFNIAVHVQGRWLRKLLLGDKEELINGGGKLLKLAQRVQLNFHGGAVDYDESKFLMELMAFPQMRSAKQFIFQVDGCQGGVILEKLRRYGHGLDLAPFYDTSHGAGVLPNAWPDAEPGLLALRPDLQVGYAGGLGPDNLAEQIPLIAKAAGDCRFWIDMETKVRSRDYFDLDKVHEALEACKPFVGRELGKPGVKL